MAVFCSLLNKIRTCMNRRNGPRYDLKPRVLFLPLLCLSMQASAQESLTVGGYYKNFCIAFVPPNYIRPAGIPRQPAIGAVNNRLRIKVFYKSSEWLSTQMAYDLSPRIQDPSLFSRQPFLTSIDPSGYRATDLESRLYPAEGDRVGSVGIFQNLDRLALELKTSYADFLLGRQAISWGSARAINPTDVLAPFAFQELDTEERIGIDALRVRVPLGALSELDGGYVFGKDLQSDKSAFFLRSKFDLSKSDVSLLLVGFRENLLIGFDIARSIGGAGFWLEAANVFVDRLKNGSTGSENAYFRATVGLDYSFGGKIYTFVEYHYNGAGAGQPTDYLFNLLTPAYAEGSVYLMGKHYLLPGMTYQLTPLVILSVQSLYNVEDHSAFIASQTEYNLAENIYVSAGVFIGMGRRAEIVAGLPMPLLPGRFHSEFGGYPDIYFSSFKIYF